MGEGLFADLTEHNQVIWMDKYKVTSTFSKLNMWDDSFIFIQIQKTPKGFFVTYEGKIACRNLLKSLREKSRTPWQEIPLRNGKSRTPNGEVIYPTS